MKHNTPKPMDPGTEPLFVDLDGTLLLTDMLEECLAVRLATGRLFTESYQYPFWLLRGIPEFKRRMAAGLQFDLSTLPVNQSFLEYLKEQHANGRELHLISASDHDLVTSLGEQFGIFASVEGTREKITLQGQAKVDLIRSKGIDRFSYAGNSCDDIPIWRESVSCVLVNTSPAVQASLGAKNIERTFSHATSWWRVVPKALRAHHWAKNLLIAVPIITAHRWLDFSLWSKFLVMFFAFSMTASGTYLINDIVDLESDRRHHTKRHRPLAAGNLRISSAIVLATALLLGGIGASFALNHNAVAILLIYFVLTTCYSLLLKSMLVVDVIVLAMLYVARIVAGHAATAIPDSFWLFTFSGTIFLSLAFLKRYIEINRAPESGIIRSRGYMQSDRQIVAVLGVTNGMISVLVLALYIHSPEVHELYPNPRILWCALPLMLAWVAQIWIKADRGQVHDDPVIHCLKDPFTFAVVLLLFLLSFGASLWTD